MDWTEEDTEILQLMNRVRQLLNKRDPVAYKAFTDESGTRPLSCKIEGLDLFLYRDERLIINRFKAPNIGTRLFEARIGPGRPSYVGDLSLIREVVVPAIDREMILEDLSMLGQL